MVKITINFLQWQCMEKQTSIGVNIEIKSDHIQDNNFIAQVLYNYIICMLQETRENLLGNYYNSQTHD